MLIVIVSAGLLIALGGLLGIFAYLAYRDRKVHENAIKNVDKYQNKIIKDEIEAVGMSLNGEDPYSAKYKKIQDDIDKNWEQSCEMLEKTKNILNSLLH